MPNETKNVAASVRAKLTNLARSKGEDLQYLLMRYARERLLYRLSQSEHRDDFLVKGATLFAVWFDEPHRPTKDLDLLRRGGTDVKALERIFKQICEIEANDGLNFPTDSIRAQEIREGAVYEGVRIKLLAMLEKARIPVQVDIGFGDVVTPEAKEKELPTILGMPVPKLKIYPKETVVAEKFEAMVKLGIANSRMKDFWDVHYLINEFDFEGRTMQIAIEATFKNRKTELPKTIPVALTDEFARMPMIEERWIAFVRRNRITFATDLIHIIRLLRDFFNPIIVARQDRISFEGKWRKEGWRI